MSLHYFDEESTRFDIESIVGEEVNSEVVDNLLLLAEDIFENGYNLGLESGRDEMVGVKIEASKYDHF